VKGRGFGRGLALGAASGVALALLAQAARPRPGAALPLLDWDEVIRLARGRLRERRLDDAERAGISAAYDRFAGEVQGPLLAVLGGLPEGVVLPPFQALDRSGWLELNVGILQRVLEPLLQATQVPDSRVAELGRAGVSRYLALMLAFLSRRVLGQFDPQLLGKEPQREALYLVEPNVAEWERQAGLPGDDLRRWLILHEMTHAWQFAAHPWLRGHFDRAFTDLIEATTGRGAARGVDRLLAVTVGGPEQRAVVRRLQAVMSLVEGHGNLAMNLVGRRVLPSFGRLEEAYRRRGAERGALEALVWRLTGLDMKMEQYRVGESFARAVHDRHGMPALNRAWESPETLPRPEELRDPDRWFRRVVAGTR
jgi:coenzyme F420 biosynthesis associated uncharacterized protein